MERHGARAGDHAVKDIPRLRSAAHGVRRREGARVRARRRYGWCVEHGLDGRDAGRLFEQNTSSAEADEAELCRGRVVEEACILQPLRVPATATTPEEQSSSRPVRRAMDCKSAIGSDL